MATVSRSLSRWPIWSNAERSKTGQCFFPHVSSPVAITVGLRPKFLGLRRLAHCHVAMYPKTLPVSSGTTIRLLRLSLNRLKGLKDSKTSCNMLGPMVGLAQTFLVSEWIMNSGQSRKCDPWLLGRRVEVTTILPCFPLVMWNTVNPTSLSGIMIESWKQSCIGVTFHSSPSPNIAAQCCHVPGTNNEAGLSVKIKYTTGVWILLRTLSVPWHSGIWLSIHTYPTMDIPYCVPW